MRRGAIGEGTGGLENMIEIGDVDSHVGRKKMEGGKGIYVDGLEAGSDACSYR